MNILIKLMSIVSLVIAPTLSHLYADKIQQERMESMERMMLATHGAACCTTTHTDSPAVAANAPSGASQLNDDGSYRYDLGTVSALKLADGTELQVGENSVERKLVNFIMNGTINEEDKSANWLSFDRMQFESGKASLKPSSEEQLKNMVAILKAYPKVFLKIGGYTDNTGDANQNLALSKARAENVKDRLVAMGVDASRLEADGYGQEFPVGDNNTEAGKARNRRIDVKVSKK